MEFQGVAPFHSLCYPLPGLLTLIVWQETHPIPFPTPAWFLSCPASTRLSHYPSAAWFPCILMSSKCYLINVGEPIWGQAWLSGKRLLNGSPSASRWDMTCGSTCWKLWALAVGRAGELCSLWSTHLFQVNFLFPLNLSNALTPRNLVCLLVLPWGSHGVLKTHNEMGMMFEWTYVEPTLSPAPSAHEESRKENVIVEEQNGINW